MVKKKYKVNKYGYGGISITDSLNNQVGNLLTPTGNAITPSITTKDIKPGFASKGMGGFNPLSIASSTAMAVDSAVGNAIAGGRSTKAGNVLSKIPGLGIASGLINRASGSQINKEAVANFEAQNKAQANTQFDASTTDDLLAQSDFNLLGDIKTSDIGKDGWFNHDASNTANRLRAERELANNAIVNNFAFTGSNVDAENDLLAMANAAAYGGPLTMRNSGVMSPFGNRFDIGGGIHIKKESRGKFTEAANRAGMGIQEYARHILANKDDYSGLLVKRANFARTFGGNKKADGGFLNTNGNNWTNNIIEVGNGNTHENNPYGGVPMGVDPEGTPNLVEQGERVWSATDYVFSNRLKVPKSIRSKYKLRDGITFSNAVDKLTKESKEKPNDPISKRGDNAILSELAMAQEELRMKEEMKKNNRQFKYGGTLGNVFARGGYPDVPPEGIQEFNTEDTTKNKLLEGMWNTTTPEYELANKVPGKDFGIIENVDGSISSVAPWDNTITGPSYTYKSKPTYTKDTKSNKWWNQLANLRYIPALGGAISAITSLAKKPDYSNADAILNAVKRAGQFERVEPAFIGDYVDYLPTDKNYLANRLNEQAAAGRAAIANQSAGNRASAIAGLTSNQYATQLGLADMYRKADEDNWKRRLAASEFNRGTNQYNADAIMKAAMANQNALLQSGSTELSGVAQAMAMRNAIDNARSAGISANLTNVFNSLGDIGREEFTRNMIEESPYLYYGLDRVGGIDYKGNSRANKGACGGKLNTRKRG